MKQKLQDEKIKDVTEVTEKSIVKPLVAQQSEEEIEKHKKLDETWCRNCQEFIYNPKLKRHCYKCGKLL
jgi:hypothetical protein